MIATTTLLVVGIIVGFGVLNVMNIRKVFDDTTAAQIKVFRDGRELLGDFGTPAFARAVEPMLINRQDAEMIALLDGAVRQDTRDLGGKRDYGLKLGVILDGNQGLVAHCFEDAGSAGVRCKPGSHEPISDTLGKLTSDAWKAALAAWTAASAGKGDVLVRFDQSDGGSKYRFFAFPVFVNGPASAAGAAATERPDARQGYVVLGYDLAPIDTFAGLAEERKSQASTEAVVYTGAVGVLFILIGTLLAIFQGLSISRPIKQLAKRADQISRGDLAARVEVKSSDEIGVLGENFNYMADQIVVLLQQTAEKARIEQELEVARTIQETLVPPPDIVDKGTLRFCGYFQPASQTGGDWWTWHDLTGGKVLLVIGDVTGHGVPSAMITAAAKAACDVARAVHNDDVTVSRLLEIMNYAIFESAKRKFVMTCFASIIDTRRRTITYANAGHNFPYLLRGNEFATMMIRGNRLGDVRESQYEAKTIELSPGDVLIWYTDGIVECENRSGEEWGEKRFRAAVKRAASLDSAQMRDAIVADSRDFYSDVPRKDDITMVVGRIY
ncbi:MAG: SpoIIE family protein phosphatase [Myxococcales bacterium]|nr:SpoIIE family protein phosphatase [Myxococcales bacterium]